MPVGTTDQNRGLSTARGTVDLIRGGPRTSTDRFWMTHFFFKPLFGHQCRVRFDHLSGCSEGDSQANVVVSSFLPPIQPCRRRGLALNAVLSSWPCQYSPPAGVRRPLTTVRLRVHTNRLPVQARTTGDPQQPTGSSSRDCFLTVLISASNTRLRRPISGGADGDKLLSYPESVSHLTPYLIPLAGVSVAASRCVQ